MLDRSWGVIDSGVMEFWSDGVVKVVSQRDGGQVVNFGLFRKVRKTCQKNGKN